MTGVAGVWPVCEEGEEIRTSFQMSDERRDEHQLLALRRGSLHDRAKSEQPSGRIES